MPQLARVAYRNPLEPVLFESQALEVSYEQRQYIKDILDLCCSDSKFAEKAYTAIELVLTGGNAPVPTVNSLNPSTVAIGAPTFDIHVIGTGFTSESKIIFNGFEEPTTFNSTTDVSTGVNMDVWLAPAVVPVGVQSASGVMSGTMNFEFTDAAVLTTNKVIKDKIVESFKPSITPKK